MIYIKRAIIVCFWIAVFFSFLYIPRIQNLFRPSQSINIFLWSGVIDPEVFQWFEKETGIHVHASYYESNEELLVKLLATRGKGYDMIVPSDYNVRVLIEKNLLQKLDKKKLNFWNKIHPIFLNHYFDPGNKYSLPAEWYLLGIGVNTDLFKGDLENIGWDFVFESGRMPNRVGLLNDSRELIGLAVKYLFGSLRPITADETNQVKQLLIKQKKHTGAYTDFRGDFLLESGDCSAAIIPISYSWSTLQDNPHIKFIIPKAGTLLGIENYAIPAASKKTDLTYKLINYLFQLEVQKHNFEKCVFFSTRKDANFLFETEVLKPVVQLLHTQSGTNQIELFKNVLTDQQVNDIWIGVKSS